jgi:ureidoacrylate peracid hydrolase
MTYAGPGPFDALLVVDMQNSFLKPGGKMFGLRGTPLANIDETIAANVRAVELARSQGTPVLYTRHCYRPGYPDANASQRRLFAAFDIEPLQYGSWDAAVVDELPIADAPIVDKSRFDSFYNTQLELLLRGLGVQRLGICGIVTNACVESTSRAAAMRDFEVTVLSDCVTTYDAADQAASLGSMAKYMIAAVKTLAEVSGEAGEPAERELAAPPGRG